MKCEDTYFIQLLSDFLYERKSVSQIDVEWTRILALAKMHQVEGILFYQCKEFLPAHLASHLKNQFVSTLYCYKNRKLLIKKIDEFFTINSIPYFWIKGINVAQYFPQPALRTMGDSDLVVHESDKIRAEKALMDLGFSRKYEFTGKERGFSFNHIGIELHHKLVYEEIVSLSVHKDFFNDCWQYINDGKPDSSFEFLFLIVHLRKHMLNEGVGIRQFLDIAVLIKNNKSLNWNWISEKLQKLRLQSFAETCFGMIDYWFGIQAPIKYVMPNCEFQKKALEKILSNGVFGFDNSFNKSNGVLNEMRLFKGPVLLFRLSAIIRRSFPGYEYLLAGEPYRFLRGRPWLLPVAWGYRFYLMRLGKTNSASKIFDRIMTKKDVINARENELRQWGLID